MQVSLAEGAWISPESVFWNRAKFVWRSSAVVGVTLADHLVKVKMGKTFGDDLKNKAARDTASPRLIEEASQPMVQAPRAAHPGIPPSQSQRLIVAD